MRSQLNNQQGTVMVAVLCVVTMLAFFASELARRQQFILRAQKPERIRAASEGIRQKVMMQIFDNKSWNRTSLSNDCMEKGVSCSPADIGQVKGFVLRDATGSEFLDSTRANVGFNMAGATCETFSAQGNDACPFRVTLTWQPTNCSAGLCDVVVSGMFSFRPSSESLRFALNERRYDFVMTRGKEDGSLQHACNSLGGVFNQATGGCSTKPETSKQCGDGQALRFYRNTNDIVCEPVFDTTRPCPVGTAARGISANGSLNCGT